MNPSLDSLARPAPTTAPVRRMPAWLIPLTIGAGFAVLFLALFRDRLLPATDVQTAVVLATAGETEDGSATAPAGEMLFQASGWIEPDPLPVKATALIDGVVDQVHVLEGQSVEKGEILATLIDTDAELALASAERTHAASSSSRVVSMPPSPIGRFLVA